jgi:hypothetical protein
LVEGAIAHIALVRPLARVDQHVTAKLELKKKQDQPWRRAIVGIASAYRTEDPEFESSQGVRFTGL